MDDVSESEGLLDETFASVRLCVIGMTCQSCVKNIEGTIKTKLGVNKIKVVLSENAAYIDYDPSLTDPKTIASDIDDMGFECPYTADYGNDTGYNMFGKVRIHISGMTCQSCVKNIEENISKKDGILKINVNLELSEGVVDYDLHKRSSSEIAEMIDNMGFEASVKSKSEYKPQKTDTNVQHIGNILLYLFKLIIV